MTLSSSTHRAPARRSLAAALFLRIPRKPHQRANEVLKRISHLDHPVGAELGVWLGRMSKALFMGHRGLKLHMVDSWAAGGADYIGNTADAIAAADNQEMEQAYRRAMSVTAFAEDRRIVQRERTDVAAGKFADQSLDFAFIDADHSYEGCRSDIGYYWPKVKTGGWLSGHDYEHPEHPQFGVRRAVDQFAQAHGYAIELGRNFTWFIRKP